MSEVIHPFYTGYKLERLVGRTVIFLPESRALIPSLLSKIIFQIMEMTSFQETCLGMYDLPDTGQCGPTWLAHCIIFDWLRQNFQLEVAAHFFFFFFTCCFVSVTWPKLTSLLTGSNKQKAKKPASTWTGIQWGTSWVSQVAAVGFRL